MENGLGKLFRIAPLLLAVDQLKPATLFFMREAAKSSRTGLVSLGALNRALTEPSVLHRNPAVDPDSRK